MNNEGITDKDYRHAKKVWNKFKINNLGEYQVLYNIIDVLLLSDVFENLRKKIYTKYNLGLGSFVTIPTLPWMFGLKKRTEKEFESLSNIDKLHIYENGIRGGITRAIKLCWSK